MNSFSNEVIIDHKDAVSHCGDGACLLDKKIVLLFELKKEQSISSNFLFQDMDLLLNCRLILRKQCRNKLLLW